MKSLKNLIEENKRYNKTLSNNIRIGSTYQSYNQISSGPLIDKIGSESTKICDADKHIYMNNLFF